MSWVEINSKDKDSGGFVLSNVGWIGASNNRNGVSGSGDGAVDHVMVGYLCRYWSDESWAL